MFGIPVCALARVCNSDAVYGATTMEGLFSEPVPICGVLGDSHAALFGQGCLKPGMIKATYGTGSSLMMNIGDRPIQSSHGVVTSLAWGRGGKVDYVLEGNLNYTGAVITWLKDDLKLISSAKETEGLARRQIRQTARIWFRHLPGLVRRTGMRKQRHRSAELPALQEKPRW